MKQKPLVSKLGLVITGASYCFVEPSIMTGGSNNEGLPVVIKEEVTYFVNKDPLKLLA